MSDSRVFGIDLGTTYSCVAYVDEHERPEVVVNSDGQLTTPSVVYFESADNIVVGQAAKEVASLESDKVVSTVKRMMGDPDWRFHAFGTDYSPQEISSFILRKLVAEAEQQTGMKIKDVVITVPAYFGVNEKEATKQAGELAGLNVRYVIPEPTAAAIAYGMESQGEQTVLVYDLGGGTFDITVLKVAPGNTRVICTGGDHHLGGRNWDETVVEYFMELVEGETGSSAETQSEDEEHFQDLLNQAEAAKQALTTREKWMGRSSFDGSRIRLELTRDKFDHLTRDLLNRTIAMTDSLLSEARDRGAVRIDTLLLVGGSTYMPQVFDVVSEKYDIEVKRFDPNQAVAKGAARFGFKCDIDDEVMEVVARETGVDASDVDLDTVDAAVVDKAQREVARAFHLPHKAVKDLNEHVVRNVTSKSFGLVVMDGGVERVSNLISKNDPVPAIITRPFSTYADNQESVDLRLMENQLAAQPDKTIAVDDCKLIKSSELHFGRSLPAGSPVEVRFELGPDGLLQVHARDVTTGRELEMSHQTEGVLSEAEKEQARARSLAITVA